MRILAVLGLLIAAPALAQSPGTVNLIGPSSTPGAPQVTTVATINAAINAALTAKADAANGVLTAPAITGGTISGAPISGAPGSFTTLSAPSPVFTGTINGAAAALSGNATIGGTLNGATLSGGTLSGYNGNLFLGSEQNAANFTGTESVFIGDRTGGNVGSGSFNWAAGHNAFGIGGGCTGIYMNSGTVTGTDTLRNACGGGGAAGFDAYGAGALKTYNQAGTSGNNYLAGTATFGANSLFYWNGAVSSPYNTVFGNDGCAGESTGTVNFTGVTCLGARGGKHLTTATNSILINGGTNPLFAPGATTFASGSGVILVASGAYAVDTPAAGTTDFINIDNTIIAVSHLLASWVSGFGTSAGGASGSGSNYELFNVGTGGTASSGVFSFPNAAPNGWQCTGRDKTHPELYLEDFSSTSTTTVTVTNYSRTTGAVTPWTSGDQLQISCVGF
jgi:hypothetical protein